MDIVAGISGLVLLIAILMGFPKRIMTNAAEVVYAKCRVIRPNQAAQQFYRHRTRK